MTWRETQPNEYIRFDVARNYLHDACQYIGSNGGLELKCRFDHEKVTTIPQWIPITERLPEENMWTICQNSAGAMMIGKYVIEFGWMFPAYFDGIIAWMPLPEPWKGGEQDDR